MARKKKAITVPLETIGAIPDAAWERLQLILAPTYPPKPTGRGRIDFRKAIDGIIFRLRTGCQWNHLPQIFGDDSSVHRWFQRWVDDAIFVQLWAILLEECDALAGVEWQWQAVDGCLGKARFGGKPGLIPPTEASRARKKVWLLKGPAGR